MATSIKIDKVENGYILHSYKKMGDVTTRVFADEKALVEQLLIDWGVLQIHETLEIRAIEPADNVSVPEFQHPERSRKL